jgi:hypothetical protein
MTMLEGIIEYYGDDSFLLATGFDEAVIGVETPSMRLIYSVTKIIEILMTRDEMTMEDAMEFYEFNIKGGWVGDLTPIWCDDMYLM